MSIQCFYVFKFISMYGDTFALIVYNIQSVLLKYITEWRGGRLIGFKIFSFLKNTVYSLFYGCSFDKR